MESLRTHRFATFVMGLIAVSCLGAAALVLRAEVALTGVVLGNTVALVVPALGFGSWHDRHVRAVRAMAQTATPAAAGAS